MDLKNKNKLIESTIDIALTAIYLQDILAESHDIELKASQIIELMKVAELNNISKKLDYIGDEIH
ncbi:MAG: hypothetical protein MJ089_05195 [Ruminococcus sp.]|nr:hypothetical protein [Ruminococcus sp.]